MATDPNDRPAYYLHLADFMSFRDSTRYNAKEATFSEAQLASITPSQIVAWFCLKVYGTPNPDFELDDPTQGRSASLSHYKKALSHYMPHNKSKWDDSTNTGNPTRSSLVRQLIARVKKKEEQSEGKKSATLGRPLTREEFEQMLCSLKKNNQNNIERMYMISAVAKFQFAMIARIRDMMEIGKEDLKPHRLFDFALSCRMQWSKEDNETEQNQILLGSMHPLYCILLALGIHLEVWLGSRLGSQQKYLFGDTECPKANKKSVAAQYHFMLKNTPLPKPAVEAGPLNISSFTKFPAALAQTEGRCSEADTDSRGRWRTVKKRNTSCYRDAKVAAALCMDGPVRYRLKEGSGISRVWLLEHVVPQMMAHEAIDNRVAIVLALPLLWACFQDAGAVNIPTKIKNRVQREYERIRGEGLEAGENPVEKVRLVVTGSDAELKIDDFVAPAAEATTAGGHWQQAIYSQLMALRREVSDLRKENWRLSERIIRQGQGANQKIRELQQMLPAATIAPVPGPPAGQPPPTVQQMMPHPTTAQLGVQRVPTPPTAQQPPPTVEQTATPLTIADQPPAGQHLIPRPATGQEAPTGQLALSPPTAATAAPLAQPAEGAPSGAKRKKQGKQSASNLSVFHSNSATLVKNPRTLHILWTEYQEGIAGRKPAKAFTLEERGRVKSMYSRRKLVWTKIRDLMLIGHTVDSAIDAIQDAYGRSSSVTYIIRQMQIDRKTGGHPALRT